MNPCTVVHAQDSLVPGETNQKSWNNPPPAYWENRGHWNFGLQLGLALENNIPHDYSHIALILAQPQVGFIVHDARSQRSPVQRFEIVNEGVLGNAIHPGGRVTGYALLFRVDGRSHGRIVPFLDAGGGMQQTTLYTRAPELSGSLQFSPQGGLGLQYFFSPQRAIVFEYRFMHMSNASLVPPNHGFNASMLTLGLRWLRRPEPGGWTSRGHNRLQIFRSLLARK